jgi:LysR family glycine cleavage system transcriptional activator
VKVSHSLKGLYYFYLAAERLSFKKAAEELHVTQAAISQQIRQLEDVLGLVLFVRNHRSVELTPAGVRLFPVVKSSFDSLQRGIDELSDDADPNTITVSVIASFAQRWLIPRLGEFYNEHPEIKVMLQTTDDLETFADGTVDLAIRLGGGKYPDLKSELLMDDYVYPVCHPLYRDKLNLNSQADLERSRLLFDSRSSLTWDKWFEREGVAIDNPHYFTGYDASHYIVEGLLAGQGVALMRHSLVADLISNGSLVRLFDSSLKLSMSYFICAPAHYFQRPKLIAFIRWLKGEAASYNHDHSFE